MNKILFIILAMPMLLMGCKEMESLNSDIEELAKLKSELSIQGPYSYEDQERFSSYFSGLNLLIKKVDEHPKGKKGLARYLKKNGLIGLCEQILVSKTDWQKIQENCWSGEYFLCSEDILDFEESLELFAKNLEDSSKTTFVTSEVCAGAWAE